MRRRRDVESLLRYRLFVESMPLDEDLIAPFPKDQEERIVDITFNPIPRGVNKEVWGEYAFGLIEEEVKGVYASTMNQIIFDSNMINPTNIQTYFDLALPIPPSESEVPYLGVREDLPC